MRWREIPIGLSVVTYPLFEPVSRAEAKWHARMDQSDEDHLIDGYIAAARRQLEKDTGYTPVNTVYDLTIERFPQERWIPFPRRPLASVASVTSYDENDVSTVMSSGDYRVDTALHRLCLNDDATWPSDLRNFSAGVIRFTAGGNATAATVSSLTSAGTIPEITATATTSSAHGYSTGDRVTIAGALEGAYNGTFTIRVTSTTVFTYRIVSGTPAANATGTITARLLRLPDGYWLAMLMLIEHFARNRGAVERVAAGESVAELPLSYWALSGGADRLYAMA